jgi:hypothetical protein
MALAAFVSQLLPKKVHQIPIFDLLYHTGFIGTYIAEKQDPCHGMAMTHL